MADDQPSRITVSRDALRADLAEMELRLRLYFDDQLRYKADRGAFLDVALKLDQLDRGDWTPVHKRALVELIEEQTAMRGDREWTRLQRVGSLLGILTGTAAFVLSTVLAFRGWS